MRRLAIVAVVTGTITIAGVTPAFGQTKQACVAALKVVASTAAPSDDPCFQLAIAVVATGASAKQIFSIMSQPDSVSPGDVFSQRDLQNHSVQNAALGGTPAQGQAMPGVQPAGVAAGTIAAVGTNAGQEAIAAISVNPAVLLLGEVASRALAQASRVMDLTVFVPATTVAGSETAIDPRRYVGVRVRLNVTGVKAGDSVWHGARDLLKQQLQSEASDIVRVQALFKEAPNLTECANALFKGDPEPTIVKLCGSKFTMTVDEGQAEKLRDQLRLVRRKADSRYFGADIRLDFGDPTLGEVADASGRFLFAGVSFGRRFTGTAPGSSYSLGVRGRVGGRHATLDSEPTSEMAIEGGLGLELARYVGDDEVNLSGALEFREGNADPLLTDQFQTNFIMLRGSVSVPVTAANSISINAGWPVRGDVSPIFSVTFNWGLLLPR